MRFSVLLELLPLVSISGVQSVHMAAPAEFFVNANTGSDRNDGSKSRPFRTLQRCHDVATGSAIVCNVAQGLYRETVNLTASHLTFRGEPGVVVSGLHVLPDAEWKKSSLQCVYRRQVPPNIASISQLFHEGNMMVEARWPNLDVRDGNVGNAAMGSSAWQKVGQGSSYGTVVDPELANHHFSWNGALATLNVGHQWNSWTRVVSNHTEGSDHFQYPQDLPGLAGYDSNKYPGMARIWDGCNRAKCNQYFLSGKLEALDAPGEWFHDIEAGLLYFYPPNCTAPPAGVIEVKERDYAFVQSVPVVNEFNLINLTVIGATIKLLNCIDCTLTALDLQFPTYDREIRMFNNPSSPSASTLISGEKIALRDFSLSQSNNGGLKLSGGNMSLDNCLISYTDWVGNLPYPPLGVTGNQISVTRCTVRDFGNAGVVTSIPNVPPAAPGQPQLPPKPMNNRFLEVAHTHIFNGGRVGEDTAALYSGEWAAAGTWWHHNWVHDTTEKCLRFDDQSENTTIHHNVVYNCGEPSFDVSSRANSGVGLVAKGDGHLIYANTIFNANHSEMCLSNCIEKFKPFRTQYPRIMQNVHSQIFNSAAHQSNGNCECNNTGPGGNLTAIYNGTSLQLVDVANFDFRPAPGSPLIDAGAIIPPYTDGYVGKAPDIGAYENGGPRWLAGCVGLSGC